MSPRLALACLLIASLLVVSCQRTGRPASAAGPVSGMPPGALAQARSPLTELPDTLVRSPVPRPSPASAVPPPASSSRPPAAASTIIPAHPPAAPAGSAPAAGGIALQPQAVAAGPNTPQKGFTSASTLLAIGRGAPMLPEDFKIGPLGDDKGEQQDQDRAVEAASRFLSDLVAGKVDAALLLPDSRQAVSDTLTFGLKRGNTPTSFRVGRPRTRDGGEVTAAVRLFGNESSSEGEIYVSRSGSQWLVADLQVSLDQLSVKSEKPKEKFFPLDYRWLLEE